MDIKYYINLSGGIDSTYYLYKFFKENPKEPIFIHHCNLSKRRGELEDRSVYRILRYFEKRGLIFESTKTVFDRRGIKGNLFDIETIYFFTGLIVKRHPSITTILMPRCWEEFKTNKKLFRHFKKGGNINNFKNINSRIYVAKTIAETIARRELNFISPYQFTKKRDMMIELPIELLKMTWFCRKPVNGNNCGKCFNCKRVLKDYPLI